MEYVIISHGDVAAQALEKVLKLVCPSLPILGAGKPEDFFSRQPSELCVLFVGWASQAQKVVPHFLCRKASPARAFISWELDDSEAKEKPEIELCEFQKTRFFRCPFHKGTGELFELLTQPVEMIAPCSPETCPPNCILKMRNALQAFKARYFHGAKFDLQKWSVLPCRAAINTFVNSEGSYDYEMDNIERVVKELNSAEWWTPLKDDFQQFCADFLTPLTLHGCPEVQNVQTSLEQFLKYANYIRRQSASKIPSEKIGRIRNRSKAALRIIKGIETAFEQLRRKLESNNNLGGASNG